MKKSGLLAIILGALACGAFAEVEPATIKLRDVDFKGAMRIDANLTLTATFDVQKEDLLDELYLDFYVLLEPSDDDRGLQFFHCRTVHRFLEEQTGYKSGAVMPASIIKAIDPSDSEYAVVVTYRGKEVDEEHSHKERWWENEDLGKPIENVLLRSTSAPTVRPWESE